MADADVEERCDSQDAHMGSLRTRQTKRSHETPEQRRGVEIRERDLIAVEELDVVAHDGDERLASVLVDREDVLRGMSTSQRTRGAPLCQSAAASS